MQRFACFCAVVLSIGCQHSNVGQLPDAGPTGIDPAFPVPQGAKGVPRLPTLSGVQQTVEGNRVSITFQPVAGAKDYRVFPLPAAADVTVDSVGGVTVKNAIYRCAGDRFAVRAVLDGQPGTGNGWTTTIVNGDIEGFPRKLADATLGYVFTEAGAGRLPVFVLGDPSADADNGCGGEIWGASRVKKYTISETERTQLLAARWRDDGIAFYAPASGDVQISTGVSGKSTLYFAGAEAAARTSLNPAAAFKALSAAAGAVPLMRVYYNGGCSNSHDELVAGAGFFERVSKQGNQPVFEVQWPSLTGDTQMVVEALDSGCPSQGILSPKHLAAAGNAKAFLTVADVQAASASGEVYFNGQHVSTNRPQAIARSFLRAQPAAALTMDWTPQLSPSPVFAETSHADHGYWDVSVAGTGWDVQYYSLEPGLFALGVVQGELWTAYADWVSDTGAKFRATPKQRATFSATSFVHATMTVDLWSTGRRYPQLIVSDVLPPVQENLASGHSLILQTRGPWPFALELQLCNMRTWDVNNQCPIYRLDLKPFTDPVYPPHPLLGELAAPMQLKRLELYASTTRAYVFVDGKPYGCANLTGAPAAGPVTVTYGDVLYHSGVDEPVIPPDSNYPFLRDYELTQTVRHFDNLGFSSGVAAPAWDTARLPCTSTQD